MVNYTCSICGYKTGRKSSYDNHLNRKNPCNNKLKNGNLNKNKDNKNKSHENHMTVDDYRMTVDDYRMTVDDYLIPGSSNTWKCPQCSTLFDNIKDLESHFKGKCKINKHNKEEGDGEINKNSKIIISNYKCNECNKEFKKKSYLDIHLKKYCKINISLNNIYKFKKSTFGKIKYGKKAGDIYIIQLDTNFNDIFKIGKTTNLYNKLNDYRCGSLIEPRLYYYYPFIDIKKAEKRLKKLLKKYNIKKDFYKCDIDILRKIILQLQKESDKNKIENEPIIKQTNLSECTFCKKFFTIKKDMFKHLKDCKKYQKLFQNKLDVNNNTKQDEYKKESIESIEVVKQLFADQKKELNELKYKLEELSKKKNIVVYNTNNITLIAYNKTPDLSHLTNNDYLKIMNKGFRSIPRLVEAIHFNPKKPENHNVYIPNIKNNYAMIWNGSAWDLTSREDIIDNMYDDKSNILIEKMEEFIKIGNELDPKIMKKFKRFIEKKENDEIKNKIKGEIKLLLYNSKGIIKVK